MNNTELLEESPNRYTIISEAPADFDDAVNYYLQVFERFQRYDYPLEFGIANYGLARKLFADRNIPQNDEEKAKRVENSLFYFNQCLDIFNHRDYPMMYALICVYMGRLYRDRAHLMTHRSFLAARGTPGESLQYGVDQCLEALHLYSINKAYKIEYAICCLELGHLITLQLDLPELCEDNDLREQAIVYLERARALVKDTPVEVHYKQQNGKAVTWRISDPKTFPLHVRLLLDAGPINFLEGMTFYLQGRVEEGWHFHANATKEELEQHCIAAFELYSTAFKPRYLTKDCPFWADSHHRAALLIVKMPQLVDADYDVDDRGLPLTDLHLQSALNHLQLAARCNSTPRAMKMDIFFHTAQTLIAQLQLIIDKVPFGQSVTQAIANNEGLDLIVQIEENLREALRRVTAANTQSHQDGFVFYFSSLKLAEYRMLQAACHPDLSPGDREAHLRDSVDYMIDATLARPLADNMDLHYIATLQLAHMLAAVKRSYAASKCFAKSLLILSVLANRSPYNTNAYKNVYVNRRTWISSPAAITTEENKGEEEGEVHSSSILMEKKLFEDILKLASSGVYAGCREVDWVKLHLGPLQLHERAAAGYASWSFEDLPRNLVCAAPSFSNTGTTKPATEVVRASPPKSVPPLQLQNVNLKKVYISGEDIPEEEEQKRREREEEFPPPQGPVPLYALGHQPPGLGPNSSGADTSLEGDPQPAPGEEPRFPQSPYIHRLRPKVPPLAQMKEIDRSNRAAYGLPKGKVAYLMPGNTGAASAAGVGVGGGMKDVVPKSKPAPQPRDRKVLDRVPGQNSLSSNPNTAHPPGDDAPASSNALDEEDDEEDGKDEAEHKNAEANPNASDDDEGGDDSSGEDGDSKDGNAVLTRPRSQRITSRPPPPSSSVSSSSSTAASRARGRSAGLLRWFSRKPARAAQTHPSQAHEEGGGGETPLPAAELPNNKFSFFPRIFGRKKAASTVASKKTRKVDKGKGGPGGKELAPEAGMWASRQAFYILMTLSRASRNELVVRGHALHLMEGERFSAVLYKAKPKYLATLAHLQSQLRAACALILPPPSTLKEMQALSSVDLMRLFRSHAKIAKKLDDLEHFLYFKASKFDYFLPLVCCAPALSRDLHEFDATLMDSRILGANIEYERVLALLREKRRGGGASAGGGGKGSFPEAERSLETSTAVPVPSYDSASTAFASSHVRTLQIAPPNSLPAPGMGLPLTADEKQQRAEEMEEVAAGKMTYTLSQALDGAGYMLNGPQGMKDMLLSSLATEDCLLIFHLSSKVDEKLTVVLIWREDSQSLHEHYSSAESVLAREENTAPAPADDRYHRKAKKEAARERRRRQKQIDELRSKGIPKGLVVEVARCDLDTSHALQYLQRFVDGLHMQSVSGKLSVCSDALRSLSCALSITELLLFIPSTVQSLIVCCPPVLRIVPWQLLLFEDSDVAPSPDGVAPSESSASGSGTRVLHLCEKYRVRLGPSLSLFELCTTSARRLRQSVGHHRLCAIDADDRQGGVTNVHEGGASRTTSGKTLGGIRGGDLEAACVTSTWSADPEDTRILADDEASLAHLETGYMGEPRLDGYKKFKRQLRNLRGLHDPSEMGDAIDRKIKERLRGQVSVATVSKKHTPPPKKDKNKQKNKQKNKKNPGEDEDGSEESAPDSDDDPPPDSDDEEVLAELRGISEQHRANVQALTACRVLHMGAHKLRLAWDGDKTYSSVSLPRDKPSSPAGRMTAGDWIRKLYLRNCALCVLSHFPLCSDVTVIAGAGKAAEGDGPPPEEAVDSNWEFIEAVHLSGACSVLFPLWELPALPHVVFLLRFYSFLPSRSRDRLSIVETVRRSALWLRHASADDIIAFVAKAPIPSSARELIIEDMEALVRTANPQTAAAGVGGASVASSRWNTSRPGSAPSQDSSRGPVPSPSTDMDPGTRGNRVGGARKYFDHFFYWGAFVVSGHGGGVHHPDLTEVHEEADEAFGDGVWGDQELDNIAFECSVLRMEGKLAEARQLEAHMRQLRLQRMKQRVERVKGAGWRAGRAVLDGLDYFDKLLLDQDSDEVSDVSSDGDSDDDVEGGGRRKGSRQGKGTGAITGEGLGLDASEAGASGKGTTGRPLASDEEMNAVISEKYNRPFRPLDLDKRNKDVVYDQWRSKVGGLGEVRAPAVRPQHRVERLPKSHKAITPTKPDNYEYAMMNAMRPEVVEDEDSGNSSAEEKKRKKKKPEKVSIWKEVMGGVRGYGEIAKMIAEKAPEIEAPHMQREECTIS